MIFMYGKSAVMSCSVFSSRDKANPSAFHLPLELSASLTHFIAIPWTEPGLSVAQPQHISYRRASTPAWWQKQLGLSQGEGEPPAVGLAEDECG